ncbi:MAG: class I SAM-dependent methyltransferase [Candidatus Omnitrophica bacterium]|nr:class I SAM-dependent methyltransferase [Candidatus Omnitrophota bacterium]
MHFKTKNEWCFRFFNSPDYLDIYQDMTGPLRTEAEIAFCQNVLHWRPGQLILDAPCGAGRHSIYLSKQGHAVVGLDFSSYLLQKAGASLPSFLRKKSPPDFVRGLLQNLPFGDETFDFIICLFSSFGYGEKEIDNLQIMKEFARLLRPNGKVLIDVMNRHFIAPRLSPVYESSCSDLFVREERTITDNGRRLHNLIQVRDSRGEKRQYLYNPWLFDGDELSQLGEQAGLTIEKIYGNFYADEYSRSSERAMMAAVKR